MTIAAIACHCCLTGLAGSPQDPRDLRLVLPEVRRDPVRCARGVGLADWDAAARVAGRASEQAGRAMIERDLTLAEVLFLAATQGRDAIVSPQDMAPGQRRIECLPPTPPGEWILSDDDPQMAPTISRLLVFEPIHRDAYGFTRVRLVSGAEDFVRHWVGVVAPSTGRKPQGWWTSGYFARVSPAMVTMCGIVDAPPGTVEGVVALMFGGDAMIRFVDAKPRDWEPPAERWDVWVDLARESGPDEYRAN